MAEIEPELTCAVCGRLLATKQGRGRRRQYCNATCRSAARRHRSRASGAPATNVNDKLTPTVCHDNLDVPSGTHSGTTPVAAASGRSRPELEPEPPGTDSPLAAITAARQLVAAAEAELQQAVDQARATGHSWREIGDVLDTTRQAAFQRFGRPVDPRTGSPMSRAVLPGAADKTAMIFAGMAAGRWEEVRRYFSETMRSRLDAERLAAGWAQTIGMIGNFERMGEALAYPLGNSTVTDILVYFEAGERRGQVSFDREGEVVGLFLRPAPK